MPSIVVQRKLSPQVHETPQCRKGAPTITKHTGDIFLYSFSTPKPNFFFFIPPWLLLAVDKRGIFVQKQEKMLEYIEMMKKGGIYHGKEEEEKKDALLSVFIQRRRYDALSGARVVLFNCAYFRGRVEFRWPIVRIGMW